MVHTGVLEITTTVSQVSISVMIQIHSEVVKVHLFSQ